MMLDVGENFKMRLSGRNIRRGTFSDALPVFFSKLVLLTKRNTELATHSRIFCFSWYFKDGVWIRGLFLEGAGWDKKNSCLIEAEPMQLVSAIPTIHFKPVENKKKSGKGLFYFLSAFTLQGVIHQKSLNLEVVVLFLLLWNPVNTADTNGTSLSVRIIRESY